MTAFAGSIRMPCRLADNVRVRKESWGLLFYAPPRHKVCFVKSGDWLSSQDLEGDWSVAGLAQAIAGRTGQPVAAVERTLLKLTESLAASGMVVG